MEVEPDSVLLFGPLPLAVGCGGWGQPYFPFSHQGMPGKGGLKSNRYQYPTFAVVFITEGSLPGRDPSPSGLAAEYSCLVKGKNPGIPSHIPPVIPVSLAV